MEPLIYIIFIKAIMLIIILIFIMEQMINLFIWLRTLNLNTYYILNLFPHYYWHHIVWTIHWIIDAIVMILRNHLIPFEHP